MPHCIMLIRHAEKPSSTEDGVDECGSRDEDSLSVRGWRRAGALAPYFGALAERVHPRVLCRPQHLLAAKPTDRHPSTRPRNTIDGLAERLGIVIDQQWSDDDPLDALARHLKSLDGPVLVCWRHDRLPDLARAIFPDGGIPAAWPDERFDLTWALRCDEGEWTFEQVPQLLLSGDRLTPIGWPDAGFSVGKAGKPEQHVLATQRLGTVARATQSGVKSIRG